MFGDEDLWGETVSRKDSFIEYFSPLSFFLTRKHPISRLLLAGCLYCQSTSTNDYLSSIFSFSLHGPWMIKSMVQVTEKMEVRRTGSRYLSVHSTSFSWLTVTKICSVVAVEIIEKNHHQFYCRKQHTMKVVATVKALGDNF